MAKQTVNIGTVANDNTGDSLRSSYNKLNDNNDEIYALLGDGTNLSITGDGSVSGGAVTIANDAVEQAMIADDAVGADQLASDAVATASIQDDAVTADKLANSINAEIAANTAKVTNATHTADVTGSTALTIANDAVEQAMIADDAVGADQLASDAVVTASVVNDNITHDKLEARYTEQTAISTLTGTVSYDCSTASSFKLSGNLTGAYTINLSNYKKGQIITIFPLQAQSITLAAQGTSTNTFNKIGGDYDNTTSSVLQIECVDDSASDPIFFYSIATFASDNTP